MDACRHESLNNLVFIILRTKGAPWLLGCKAMRERGVRPCPVEPGRAPRTSLNTLKVACAARLLERTARSCSGYTLTTGTSLGPSSTTVRATGGPDEGYLFASSTHSDQIVQQPRMLLATVNKGPCSGRAP